MELTVVGYNGQWYAVNFSGSMGWMAGWVSTLLGNCGGLTFITAPAMPPTAPPAPTTVPGSGGQPDLYVSEFSLDPATPVQGQPVSVRVGVYNRGTAAASGSFHISWYRGRELSIARLRLGFGRVGRQRWTHPDLHLRGLSELVRRYQHAGGGRHKQHHRESDEFEQPLHAQHQRGADCGGGSGGQPDLYVSEFSLDPATPVQGQPVSVRVGVYNRGTAAVSGTLPHRVVRR